MLRPLVSIIIPTYNRLNLLKESIKSVKSQTYENIELIIIDDNSDEINYDILIAEFNTLNIIYHKNKKNEGATACRNKGIELATGEYISFLDSDDVILPIKIEKLVERALNSNADYVYAGWKWKNFETSEIRRKRLPDANTGLIDGKPRWCYNIVPELVKVKLLSRKIFIQKSNHTNFLIL